MKSTFDIVILYVDGNDPQWLSEKDAYLSTIEDRDSKIHCEARFRSWDTLKYVLRSIDKYAKNKRTVHLVVAQDSQVPSFIDRSKIHIVYHNDFIPNEFLPTFSSRTIGMFIPFIPGLSENYIVFEDDMILLKNLPDLFAFDQIHINSKLTYLVEKFKDKGYYKQPLITCWNTAIKYTNSTTKSKRIPANHHGCYPFKKSICREAFHKAKKEIRENITPFREPNNFIHYYYTFYGYLKGVVDIHYPFSVAWYQIDESNLKELTDTIIKKKSNIVCINDNNNINNFEYFKTNVVKLLEQTFPQQSIYENHPRVALCGIVKNENKYLKEWIEYHKKLGFDNILLYDNNDGDGESLQEFQSPFVKIIDWRDKKNAQIKAYNDCLAKFENDYDWIMFIDIDEYLTLLHHNSIKDFLSQTHFNDKKNIFINWMTYGDNEELDYKELDLNERFKNPCDFNTEYKIILNNCPPIIINNYGKSIIKTGEGLKFKTSMHIPQCTFQSDCQGNLIPCSKLFPFNYSGAYIKHFYTKSTQEWCDKIKRGDAQWNYNPDELRDKIERYFYINKWSQEKEDIIKKNFPEFEGQWAFKKDKCTTIDSHNDVENYDDSDKYDVENYDDSDKYDVENYDDSDKYDDESYSGYYIKNNYEEQ